MPQKGKRNFNVNVDSEIAECFTVYYSVCQTKILPSILEYLLKFVKIGKYT